MSADPILSRSEIRAVDQRAMDELGIPGLLLMENAGRGAAELLAARFDEPQRVCILCGPGNNGGDGYVVARHLALAGWKVTVIHLAPPERSRGDAGVMREIVRRLGLPSAAAWEGSSALPASSFEVYVDAVLGTGFRGAVRSPLDDSIRWLNERSGAKFSLDLPSGLDCDSGSASDPTVRADETLTFAACKRGLVQASAREWTGSIHVVSIGVSNEFVGAGSNSRAKPDRHS